MRIRLYYLVLCGIALLPIGCGESGNTVVTPAEDNAEMEQAMNEMQSQFEGEGGGKSPGN